MARRIKLVANTDVSALRFTQPPQPGSKRLQTNIMKQLQDLMNDISAWSDVTFGDGQRNPAIVYHLKKEVDELIQALDYTHAIGVGEFRRQLSKTKMEYADCFMLLLDSAHHFGLTAENLLELTREKLEINKKREWGKPDANGVVEHIKHPNRPSQA